MRDEILADLYEHRYTINHNIFVFLVATYPNLIIEQARDVIISMIEEDEVYGDKNVVMQLMQSSNRLLLLNTFSPNRFNLNIKISPLGIKEHQENVFREQVKETNKAVKDSSDSSVITNTSVRDTNDSIRGLNSLLKVSNIISLVIAAITGAFIALTFLKDDAKALQSTNKLLEQQVKTLNCMLQAQKEIDSSLRIMAKDSVKRILVLKKAN